MRLMIDWDDIRYFLAVARRGSITSAARDLGVNHSTVSRRIAAFEDNLGVRLFDRLATGYTLTPAGQEMVPSAQRMEEEALDKSESGLEATHAPAARLPTLSRSLGSQRHVSLAKSVRRKRRSDRLEL